MREAFELFQVVDSELSTFSRDNTHFLKVTHLNTSGFTSEADNIGDDTMSGGKIDNQFSVFNIAIIVSELKKNGSNFILGITIDDVTLVDKIV